MEKDVQAAIEKNTKDIIRVGIDLNKESPFSEYLYKVVTFTAANVDVTVRHTFLGKGEILVIPLKWVFSAVPAATPAVYFLAGTPQADNYIKVRSTIAGTATLLLVLRHSEEAS